MGNRNYDFFVRYIDPDEAAIATPAKRRERISGCYSSTTVGRALTKFYADVADKPDIPTRPGRTAPWLKKDIVILDVMRGKGQAGPQMIDSEDDDL